MDYSNDKNRQRRKAVKSKKKKAKNKVRVIIFRILVAVILISCFAGAGAVFGAYMGIIDNADKIDNIAVVLPQNYASIVYDENGKEIDRYTGEENREYVTLDQIPINLQNAFIAIEDERFYSHNGIDLKGIVRGLYSTVFQKNKQGASTITQQLIKNNVLNISRNTIQTKLQEQYMAVQYENMLEEKLGSKEAAKAYILEVYMNSIGLNHGLNGVQTASKYYFDKDVSDLTLSECAVIAAITQLPTYYTPALNPENNKVRQQTVLWKMLELEFITEAEYNEAINDNVYDRVGQFVDYGSDANKVHSYYSDELIRDIAKDLQIKHGYSSSQAFNLIYNGGLEIHTPIDTSMQDLLEEAFMNDEMFSSRDFRIDVDYFITVKNTVTDELKHSEENFSVSSYDQIEPEVQAVKDQYLTGNYELIAERTVPTVQPQAAMAIMEQSTGYVKAIIGGRGEKTSNLSFNRATQATRQPGSVFKVLAAFAPAIDLGVVSPGTVYMDEPYTVNGYSPSNWYSGYRGAATIRDGIRNSMNVVTVQVLVDTGIDACYDYLTQFGFSTLVYGEERNGRTYTDRIPALALGGITDGVTVLETTAAYATIANNGVYMKPTFYTVVYDHDGEVLLEYIPEEDKRQVLKPSTAYMLTDMMKDVITNGTGGKARLSNMPMAGKTGTTTDAKDLTFAGYTPYYTSAIWYGYDRSDVIKDDSGYHMTIWRYVMNIIHEGLEYKDFVRPEGITTATLCTDSGLLAVAGLCDHDIRGSRSRTDLVAVGNVPTESCNVHASITIDSATGMLADSTTPEDRRFTFVGVVVPDDKVTDKEYEIPESMLIPGSKTRLNGTFTGEAPDVTERYIYDSEGNILGIKSETEENDAPVIPDTDNNTAPVLPSVPDTSVPTPQPVETPQPIFTDPIITDPIIDNYNNDDAPPIIE